MKKILIITALVIFTLALCIPICAEEYPYSWEEINRERESNVAVQLIEKHISDKEKNAIYANSTLKVSNRTPGHEGETVFLTLPTDVTIIKIYPQIDWQSIGSNDLRKLVEAGEKESIHYEFLCDYSEQFNDLGLDLLAERSLRLRIHPNVNQADIDYSMIRMGALNDIKDIICRRSVDFIFLGKKCTVSNIYFFENFSLGEMIVYFITDQGVFVRYYEHTSSAITFSQKQFTQYARAYGEFLSTSTSEGYGPNISFVEFLKKEGSPEYDIEGNELSSAPEKVDKKYVYIAILCTSICTCAILVGASLCIKRFKRRKS